MNSIEKVVKALSAVTQVSLTMLTPVALCIWFGNYLVSKHSYPQFTMVILIVLGVSSGFYSMIKYLIAITKEDK